MSESVSESSTILSDLAIKISMKILHVDDDPSFLRVAKQILEMQGEFEVETACSVEEAIEKMKEASYDAIVADYQMPGKDGLQFLKELRERNNRIPFIMFTGKSREEVAIQALNLGADNYVNKHDDTETTYAELAHYIRDAVDRKGAEEALRKSEESLKLSLKAAEAGMWDYDFRGKKMTWSPELYAVYGLRLNSVEPSRDIWLKYVHPGDRDRVNKEVTNAIEGKRDYVADYRTVWPDGTIHWISEKGRTFYDGMGLPLRMTGISIDVTRNKQSDEELNRLGLIVQSSDDAIISKSLDGTIISWNLAAQRIYGYASEEVKGKPISIIVPPELQSETPAILEKIKRGEHIRHYMTVRTSKDGKRIDVSLTISPIRDANGEIIGASTIARDITERKKAEKALRESEERYHSLFEQSPFGIGLATVDSTLIDANKAMEDLFEYSEEELKKMRVSGLYENPEQRKTMLKAIEQHGAVTDFQARLKRKNGESFDALMNVSRICITGHSLLQTTIQDITDRKKWTDELKSSEERLKILFEFAPDAYYLSDLKGNFVDGNKAAEEITGYSKGELIGKSFLKLNLLPRSQIPKAAKLIALNVIGKPTGPDELILNRKDGTQISVEIRTFPTVIHGQKLVLGIARDITERKKAEKVVLESQQRFAALFDHNPEATVYTDSSFHIVDINPRFTSLFSYVPSEVKGKHLTDVVVPERLIAESEVLEKKAAEGYATHDTVRERKDGSLVPVSVSCAPIFTQDKLAGYISVYKDISEQTNAQKKLTVLNEKLQVVGGLTRHDVRNKLSAIVGNAYLAKKETAGNNRVQEYLGEIEKAVHQSATIFDFAKTYEMLGIEGLTYIDVEKTIKGAASLFSDLKGAKVVNDCYGLTVLADSLLQQLFYNLIDNSLKYGQKTTRIMVHYEKSGENDLILVYEDDGVGIPDREKPKLFNQGYSTGGSTGYGLYLIKKMTDVYGWTIQEKGEPGKGARFVIKIPETNTSGRENYRIM